MFFYKKTAVILIIFLITFTFLFTQTRYTSQNLNSLCRFERDVSNAETPSEIGCQSRLRMEGSEMKILYWTSFYGAKQKMDRKIKCGPRGQQICQLVSNRSNIESSHAVVFHGWRQDMLSKEYKEGNVTKYEPKDLPPIRYQDQYWVLFMLESPYNYREPMKSYDALFNWTWTYRTDSDIYMPYGRFKKLDKPNTKISLPTSTKNKTITWVLSNCRDVPSKRLDLVKKLQKYIQVDIYGKCGPNKCPAQKCKTELGKEYKFYLSLENSLCQDYVTEKLFQAYTAGMVPIVYGSANYNLFLPRGSYINMNSFPSAKSLADYLVYLNENPEEYLKYFEWKRTMKIQSESYDFNTAYCRLCEKIHRDYPLGIKKIIPNMTDWLFWNEEKKYPVCNSPLDW